MHYTVLRCIMAELRHGEEIIHIAFGKCIVCKEPIPAGEAVQLSKYTNAVRHVECMPGSDNRYRYKPRNRRKNLAD
jgi:hypothetical protein